MNSGTDKHKVRVYVRLLNEGTDVSRPTEAIDLGSGLFQLLPTPDHDVLDESWEFPPGTKVRCEERVGRDGSYLLATSAAGSSQ